MPSYKLTYFRVRYRPEVIRLMFHAAKVPFEDFHLSSEEFTNLKTSGALPLGQLPFLEVDGRVMVQSRAIQRYVARELSMYGESNLEKEEIDEVTETCDDLVEMARPWWYREKDPEKKEASRKTYLEEDGPRNLTFLENKLEKSSSGFFVGSKMSLADIAVCNIVDILTDTMPELVAKYPKLVQLKTRVQSTDGIAEYLKNRPQTSF